jgi:hypothetical protein
MWICAVACRDMMPDPAFFADCLRQSFQQLADAASALQAHEQAASASEKRPAGTRRKKATRAKSKSRQSARAQ